MMLNYVLELVGECILPRGGSVITFEKQGPESKQGESINSPAFQLVSVHYLTKKRVREE